MLHGRAAELSVIDRLLDGAYEQASSALIVRGEPGIGKTALLAYAAHAAADWRVLRGAGVESEVDLPFAGLHLLLRPAVDRLAGLPEPQRAALQGVFGLTAGTGQEPVDRLLVGLAVLSLLSELAEDGPLLCLVDDAHGLDPASAQALLFAARRLGTEGVVMVFAARDTESAFTGSGLPELRLGGLDPSAATMLLDEHDQDLAPDLRRRVLTEAGGNPLAITELPTALADVRAGDVRPGPAALPLTDRLREAFAGRVGRLPDATRSLLVVAAAHDAGDLDVVLRAGARLGAGPADLEPAERSGLVRADLAVVTFRHPLVRAAVYASASHRQRVDAHEALAATLDGPDDAERRAWHRAATATEPDEDIAAELARTAAAGGYAAAVSAHERAAQLTPPGERRAQRLALAAEAALNGGDLRRATDLATRAGAHTTDLVLRSRLAGAQGTAAFYRGSLPESRRLLVNAASMVAADDPRRAADLLLDAVHVGWYLGAPQVTDAAERIAALPLAPDDPLSPVVRLLVWCVRDAVDDTNPDRLAALVTDARDTGYGGPDRLILVAATALQATGQDAEAHRVATDLLRNHRERGWLGQLPPVLSCVARSQLFHGRHAEARDTAEEGVRIARAAGHDTLAADISGVLAVLAALRGDADDCHTYADDALAVPEPDVMAPGLAWAHWAHGLLHLGAGRWQAAISRFDTLARSPARHQLPGRRSIPDRIEAAVRLGRTQHTADALAYLADWADRVRQPWLDAVVLRCRAMLAPDADAERFYLAALERHEPDSRDVERARTHLLYGEWLRRSRRKVDARTHLRAALDVFEPLGAAPWAARACAELAAAGDATTPAAATPGPKAVLTPQEQAVTRLAAQGLSNRDIAARLFLSPRTVANHLYKAFPKLGIVTRADLPTP
ncbi:MAG TPA: AAA family ATPase [Actinocatenispora sp.]